MTIIVALKTHTGVLIGSDRLSIRSGYLKSYVETKWVKAGMWWIGLAGNSRMRTLIGGHNALFDAAKTAFDVMEQIRDLAIADNWKFKEEPLDPGALSLEGVITDGVGIFAFSGAFTLQDRTSDGVACAGSGEEIALGVKIALTFSGITDHVFVMRQMLEIPSVIQRDCDGEWIFEIKPEETTT